MNPTREYLDRMVDEGLGERLKLPHTDGRPYRPELPQMPDRIKKLPRRRGYPVPWFVAVANGDYDFRVADSKRKLEATYLRKCWVCGQKIVGRMAFVIGPMCAVNRVSAEPPCHPTCADWSTRACPFMLRPNMVRREKDMPAGAKDPPGEMLRRNPEVMLIWQADDYHIIHVQNEGNLFRIGSPVQITPMTKGREATQQELIDSINSGLPLLKKLAADQGKRALRMLEFELGQATRTLGLPEGSLDV